MINARDKMGEKGECNLNAPKNGKKSVKAVSNSAEEPDIQTQLMNMIGRREN